MKRTLRRQAVAADRWVAVGLTIDEMAVAARGASPAVPAASEDRGPGEEATCDR